MRKSCRFGCAFIKIQDWCVIFPLQVLKAHQLVVHLRHHGKFPLKQMILNQKVGSYGNRMRLFFTGFFPCLQRKWRQSLSPSQKPPLPAKSPHPRDTCLQI